MLKSNELIFDEELELLTSIDNLYNEVYIILSDELEASEEDELSDNYKSQIATFVNCASDWHSKAVEAINDWARKLYKVETVSAEQVQLQSIYVLFEQDEEPLFGLEFRVAFDEEHGCGVKITGEEFQIIEVGEADIAFG